MAGLISEAKFNTMKSEVRDVVVVLTDDTKNSEQTVQLISEIAGVAIATQGLAEVPGTSDKIKIVGQILLELGAEFTHDLVVGEPEVTE